MCVFRPIPHMSSWPGQHSLLGASRETALQLLCSYSSQCPTVQWLQLFFQRIWNSGVVKVKKSLLKDSKICSDILDFKGEIYTAKEHPQIRGGQNISRKLRFHKL